MTATHVLSDLRLACLVASGLFIAEDAVVIAVRSNLRLHLPSAPGASVAIDVFLAAVMLGYNYAASRFVVDATGRVAETMRSIDHDRRAPGDRSAPTSSRRPYPLELFRRTAQQFPRVATRAKRVASRRGLRRGAALLRDLAAVNVLGVPGAALATARRGGWLSRKESLRQCSLFVASWFLGAWLIEVMVRAALVVPGLGGMVADLTALVGWILATLTDVTRPPGAAAAALLVVGVLLHAGRVERKARSMERPLPT